MNISIGPLEEPELPEADRIFRVAFGTFLGLPDPAAFAGDSDWVTTRWRADPTAAVGAYIDEAVVGSNFATRWGSFAFFGPLTVRPDLWDKGVAKRLLEATMALFESWGTRQAALFTFPHSTKHVALYQRFGFWPQQLTAVMSKRIEPTAPAQSWSAYSSLSLGERERCLAECRGLTEAVFPGLDVSLEITSVAAQRIGDTVLLRDGETLSALAICHIGAGSEAGSNHAYVKFGAARPGPSAAQHFGQLLSACEALAGARGAGEVVAGVNTARHDAYRSMIARGFRTSLLGIAMQRPDEPGYNRRDCFVMDDWR